MGLLDKIDRNKPQQPPTKEELANVVLTKATGMEWYLIKIMTVMNCKILEYGKKLDKRFAMYQNGMRDWKLLQTMLYKCEHRLFHTLDADQQYQFNKMGKFWKIIIDEQPNKAVDLTTWHFISNKDLTVLNCAAIDGHCTMCMKNKQEAKGCKLRIVLQQYCPTVEDFDPDGSDLCEYSRIASEGAEQCVRD